jgi:hypothetical protein
VSILELYSEYHLVLTTFSTTTDLYTPSCPFVAQLVEWWTVELGINPWVTGLAAVQETLFYDND